MSWFASRVRFARPTDQFEAVVRFYEQGLGLAIIGTFEAHDGYDGVIFGMPDATLQLEFTHHVNGSPCPAPTKDNLLVFYIETQSEMDAIVERLTQMGYPEVEPENPYWIGKSVTIADPDGWRIVLYRL